MHGGEIRGGGKEAEEEEWMSSKRDRYHLATDRERGAAGMGGEPRRRSPAEVCAAQER